MKESRRLHIEQRLQELADWRASGLTLKDYAQQQGQELDLWRARLTWERRWQQMLAREEQQSAQQKQATTFVKAITQQTPAPSRSHAHSSPNQNQLPPNQPQAQDSICIVMRSPNRPDLQAHIHWPIQHIARSSAWLREVLA